MRRLAILTVTFLAIGGAANAQQSSPHGQMPMQMQNQMQMPMHSMMPRESDTVATKGYKAAMMKMMRDMPKEATGNADIDFMQQMKVHHQSAIDMAEVVLANGRDDEVRKLAREIVEAQKREIGEIDSWLARNKR
jgi:uncharacterized protein (DUF305 family)